jgi:hypothetical protein
MMAPLPIPMRNRCGFITIQSAIKAALRVSEMTSVPDFTAPQSRLR